jgi:hypothetical protein
MIDLDDLMAALDIAVVVLLVLSPLACLAIGSYSRPGQGEVRVGYLAYSLCAVVVGLFQLHLAVDGGDIFMVFDWFLAPIVIAAVLAFIMTAGAHNRTLELLAGATLALGVAQVLAFADVLGTLMNWIALAYAAFVLGTAAWRWRDWWPEAASSGTPGGRPA